MGVDCVLIASGAPGERHQAGIGEGDGVGLVLGADRDGLLDQGRWPVMQALGETGRDRLN